MARPKKKKTLAAKKDCNPARDKNGRFAKGNCGGPGRKADGESIPMLLQAAINKVQKKLGRDLLEHFVERAYEDDKVLVALMRKLIPDQIKGQVDGDLTGLVEIRWAEPQEKL